MLVVIHFQIDVEGKLVWHLLGCPVVESSETVNASLASGSTALASGSNALASGSNFRFHSAEALVPLVHAVEAQYGIHAAGRRARLALTVGDGAICGPGSINFVRWESKIDGCAHNMLREGFCAIS